MWKYAAYAVDLGRESVLGLKLRLGRGTSSQSEGGGARPEHLAHWGLGSVGVQSKT